MKIEDFINEAEEMINRHKSDRDLGNGEKTIDTIVHLFNEITGNDLTVQEGNIFMVLTKIVRMQRDVKNKDHYVDAIAYLAMAGESANIERSKV